MRLINTNGKNKGFTLVELLGVIIVLAIIAVVAIPILIRVIENIKMGSAERSATHYLKEVETQVMARETDTGEPVPDGTYTLDSNGDICLLWENEQCKDPLKINMNGKKPTSGRVVIANSKVFSFQDSNDSTSKRTSIIVDGYQVSMDKDGNLTTTEYDPICRPVTLAEKSYEGTVPGADYKYGDEFICQVNKNEEEHFFVLALGKDTVSLILNRNVGVATAWCNEGSNGKDCKTKAGAWDNTKGPLTATKYLKEQTSTWSNLKPEEISLPTYEQLINANKGSITNLPTWLYANLDKAYWLADRVPGKGNSCSTNNLCAYNVKIKYKSIKDWDSMNSANETGVRPVITISKGRFSV